MVTENILHNFRGYSYTISLKALGLREYNEAYYGGFNMQNHVILKSGGMGVKKSTSGGTNLDYVVNRLEMDTVMAYNRRNRTSNAMSGTMEIFEPYSMVLLEDIQAAARSAGFGNYLQAPFLLSIHFQPSTDHNFKNDSYSGASSNMIKHIPIKIISLEFEVNASGATYELGFIPYNAMATMDSIAYTKIANTINMAKLGDLKDFADKLTAHEREYADKENIKNPNKYEIHLNEELVDVPMGFEETSLDNPIVTSKPVPVATPQNPNQQKGAGATPDEVNAVVAINNAVSATQQENARVINSGGTQVKQITVDSPNADGTFTRVKAKVPQYDDQTKFDPANAQFSNLSRGFKFQAKEDILGIIDKIMLSSDYCTSKFEENADGTQFVSSTAINNGKVDWYQIVPQIKLDAEENGGNGPAYIVKYKIHKSAIDANLLQTGTNSTMNNYNIKRTYDYIYTGKNDDIIDFRIKYDALFYEATHIYADQKKAEEADKSKVEVGNRPIGLGGGGNIANFFTTLADELYIENGKFKMQGFNYDANPVQRKPGHDEKNDDIDIKSKNVTRAKHLADLLENPGADLIRLDMTILGDPFYILTKEYFHDGERMQQIIQNEEDIGSTDGMVYINVNFKQPERGDIDQSKGIIPVTKTAVFSGVYKVIDVTHTFENGTFTQFLTGMRIKNQSAKSSGTSVGNIFRTAKNVFTSNAVQEKAKKFNYGGK